MSAAVFTDHEGHRWPVTGFWCSVCGLPMHPVNIAFGTHPNCDIEGEP